MSKVKFFSQILPFDLKGNLCKDFSFIRVLNKKLQKLDPTQERFIKDTVPNVGGVIIENFEEREFLQAGTYSKILEKIISFDKNIFFKDSKLLHNCFVTYNPL